MTHVQGPDGKCLGCVAKLTQCDPGLATWFWKDVASNHTNAHVAWSYRSQAEQTVCVASGSSKLPWPKSAHNRRIGIDLSKPYDVSNESDPNTRPCSFALDLFEIINDQAVWRPSFFYELSTHLPDWLLWGGTWRRLGDRDHFEVISERIPVS